MEAPFLRNSVLSDSVHICLPQHCRFLPYQILFRYAASQAPAHPAEILEDYGTPATPESERKLPDVKS